MYFVNPTMTPPGVEQKHCTCGVVDDLGASARESDDDAPGR